MEIECGGMNIVGSGFSHVLRDHPGGGTELRIVTGRRDFHFLHRLLRRHNDLKSAEAIGRVSDPVDFILTVAEKLAVDQRCVEF